ncbi:hypothetical protein ACSDQ9_13440 [Aestuariimicrobium soli]|uniref:hypothetical protein n=1 Tax=Aestuariimicrobium soli TaxID=2035834 RepID=UPI003EB71364
MTNLVTPPVAALAVAVAQGQYGLPHALHGHLFTPTASARQLATRAFTCVETVLGPCTGPVACTGDDDTWTVTALWRPGVLVTLLIGRSLEGADEQHDYRLLASGGQALVDALGPRFTLIGATTSTLSFVPAAPDAPADTDPKSADEHPLVATCLRSLA